MQGPDIAGMFLQALKQNIGLFVLIGLMLIGLAVFKAFLPRIKGWLGERAVRQALDAEGYKHLHDLYLPSRDGVTQVDHVAMVGRAIVVIETKHYAGWIFGEEKQAQWTQSLAGGRSKHRFQNPLRQNHGHLKAMEAVVGPGVEVLGLVVFTGSAHFPKGMPPGVIKVEGLRKWLVTTAQGRSGSSPAAWGKLAACVGGTDRRAAKTVHRGTVERAKARVR